MRPRTVRVFRNAVIGTAVVLLSAVLYALAPGEGLLMGLSIATAYVGLALIAATLCLGPLNVIRGRANPVSTYLRRDLGIWAGFLTTTHVTVGLQRHMGGEMARYFFFFEADRSWPTQIRLDLFGLANWIGVAGAIICIALLGLSNDRSLRRLGPKRWKALQRWNYSLLALSLAHGIAYQWLEDRAAQWVLAGLFVCLVALTLQLFGLRSQLAERR